MGIDWDFFSTFKSKLQTFPTYCEKLQRWFQIIKFILNSLHLPWTSNDCNIHLQIFIRVIYYELKNIISIFVTSC